MSRVLHIEDDPRNRLLVRKLLAAEGHEVIDATDGLEGVRRALTQRPDLVLVDLNIPGLDGYEVTLRLRGEAVAQRRCPSWPSRPKATATRASPSAATASSQKPIDARSFAAPGAPVTSSGHREPYTRAPTPRASGCACRAIASSRHLEQKVAELVVGQRAPARGRAASHRVLPQHQPRAGDAADANRRLPADDARRGARRAEQAPDQGDARDGRLRPAPALDARQPHRRDGARDRADAVLPPRVRLPRHRSPRGRRPTPTRSPSGSSRSSRRCRAGRCPPTATRSASRAPSARCSTTPRKFTPEGGTVGVRVRVLEAHYEVLVADSGAGRAAGAGGARVRPVLSGRRIADARARGRRRGAGHRAARGARARRRRAGRRAGRRSRGRT